MPKVAILIPGSPTRAFLFQIAAFNAALKPPHVEPMAAEPAGLHGWRA